MLYIIISFLISVVTSVCVTLVSLFVYQSVKNRRNQEKAKEGIEPQSVNTPSKPTTVRVQQQQAKGSENNEGGAQQSADSVSNSRANNSSLCGGNNNTQRNDQHDRNGKRSGKGGNETRNQDNENASKTTTPQPNGVEFIPLAISDEGKLDTDTEYKQCYYQSWQQGGKRYYRFHCDDSIVKKAINNHSYLIDPFCEKVSGSVDFGKAEEVETVEKGVIDENNSIIKKTKIKLK